MRLGSHRKRKPLSFGGEVNIRRIVVRTTGHAATVSPSGLFFLGGAGGFMSELQMTGFKLDTK